MANKYTAYRQVTDTHKECSCCGELKPHLDFHKDKNNKHAKGLAYYCKVCATKKARAWHHKHKNEEKYVIQRRNAHYQRNYGISLQEHSEKLAQQNYACAICGVKLSAHGKHTHVDHDHKTGKLRAFLCTNCNRGLGSFKDNVETLSKAIQYLNAHRDTVVVSEQENTNDCTH